VLDTLREAYDRPLYDQKCSALFEHIFESYPERDTGIHFSMAGGTRGARLVHGSRILHTSDILRTYELDRERSDAPPRRPMVRQAMVKPSTQAVNAIALGVRLVHFAHGHGKLKKA
jgi:hypothetical protein